MATTKLRASNDVMVETVLNDTISKKRIIVQIETDDDMPVVMGKCTFEFHGTVAPASNTQCKNVVNNFLKMLNR